MYRRLGCDTYGPYGGIVLTVGLESSVLRSEVSFGYFGTGPKCPDTSDPPLTVAKCLSADLSRV